MLRERRNVVISFDFLHSSKFPSSAHNCPRFIATSICIIVNLKTLTDSAPFNFCRNSHNIHLMCSVRSARSPSFWPEALCRAANSFLMFLSTLCSHGYAIKDLVKSSRMSASKSKDWVYNICLNTSGIFITLKSGQAKSFSARISTAKQMAVHNWLNFLDTNTTYSSSIHQTFDAGWLDIKCAVQGGIGLKTMARMNIVSKKHIFKTIINWIACVFYYFTIYSQCRGGWFFGRGGRMFRKCLSQGKLILQLIEIGIDRFDIKRSFEFWTIISIEVYFEYFISTTKWMVI